ncbi:hypothetical protein PTKIN_Ptkin09bG0169700 [Pterospermum kingtungense]
MTLHLHPPPHKQASITPLPLPLPSSQNNMLEPGTEQPKSYLTLLDHLGRRSSDSYDSYVHDMNYDDSRTQQTAPNFANYRGWNSVEGRFGAETSMVEDVSGVSTPPLWRTSPSRSHPHRQSINYRCLSPSSKAQAIARGQRELMEMVSRMPESCYELSLKDLVEHQHVLETKQESFAEGRGVVCEDAYKKEMGKKKKKQTNPKPQIKRSGSIDNGGFLLKMVFPISLGSKKKKKKNDSSTNYNSKLSSKPMASDASSKSVDKEWWKKRSGSSESESGGSSINSGSTKSNRSSSSSSSCRSISISSRRRRRSGCLAFLLARKWKISR